MQSTEQLIAEFEDYVSRDTSCVALGVAYSGAALRLQSRGHEALPAIANHLELVTCLDSPNIQAAWVILLGNMADELGSDRAPGPSATFDSWVTWAKREAKYA